MKRTPRSSPRSGKPQRTVSIVGTGSYVPEKVLTNDDLSKMVDTYDEWITIRTGIKERRIAADDEYTSDMAAKAAQAAMEHGRRSRPKRSISSSSPRPRRTCFSRRPPVSFRRKSARTTPPASMSPRPARVSFSRVEIAQQFITSHTYDTVLVIGAEKLSSITDWTDRNTCVLFGDGAGAAILRHRGGESHGVISTPHRKRRRLCRHSLHARRRLQNADHTRERGDHLQTIKMTGKEVYKQAVIAMLDAAKTALEKAGLTIDDIACVIPHQANCASSKRSPTG